jgi:hypothetical protein
MEEKNKIVQIVIRSKSEDKEKATAYINLRHTISLNEYLEKHVSILAEKAKKLLSKLDETDQT